MKNKTEEFRGNEDINYMDHDHEDGGSNSEGENPEDENHEGSFFDDEMGSRFVHRDDCHQKAPTCS